MLNRKPFAINLNECNIVRINRTRLSEEAFNLNHSGITLHIVCHRAIPPVPQPHPHTFFDIVGFHEMSVEQVAQDANLTTQQAQWAKKREYDEPFKIKNNAQTNEILKHITKLNLRYMKGGRYYHLVGLNDKGRAVLLLSDLFRKKFGLIQTIGIGDSENDFSMLDCVDHSYVVQQKNGKYSSSRYTPAGGIGPEGWQNAIETELIS